MTPDQETVTSRANPLFKRLLALKKRGVAPEGDLCLLEGPKLRDEALAAGADALLLDNMSVEEMRRVVEEMRGRAQLEASGGVTLENVRAVAESGVDVISVGAITHSAGALDISLEINGRGELP